MNAPSLRSRLIIACAIGIIAAAIVIFATFRFPSDLTDLDQVWFAARAILHGRDPYSLIGPGRELNAPFPLFYPLTAAVAAAPLGLLPLIMARALFTGLSSGLLAFLITRDGYLRLPIFLSGAYVGTLQLVQWTPLLASTMLFPALGFVLAAKPHLGIVLLAAKTSWRDTWIAAAGILLVTLITFMVQPNWFGEWIATFASPSYFRSYVMAPGGPLLLLALLRWRRWDARMLATLSVIPQTPAVTTTLLLLLIPRTRVAVMVLSILTFVPLFVGMRTLHWAVPDEAIDAVTRVTVYSVYFPVLYLVLREPNAGSAPVWLERVVAYLPAWIRGRPA